MRLSAYGILFCWIFSALSAVYAQPVTFQSPIPWITLRDSKLVTKVLIDTADLKNGSVVFTLLKIEKGKETKLASKTVGSNEYSQEFSLFSFREAMFGGADFYRLVWSVPGKKEKQGTIEPFGIALLAGDSLRNVVLCRRSASSEKGIGGSAVAQLKEEEFLTIGKTVVGFVWNEKYFGVVVRSIDDERLSLSFDGKNGKNAFLSFSDRVVEYSPKTDSLVAVYHKRGIVKNSIVYERKPWVQTILMEKLSGVTLIQIPWHDMGIVAAEKRTFGFAAQTENAGKKSVFPSNAQQDIPGTWGNITLAK